MDAAQAILDQLRQRGIAVKNLCGDSRSVRPGDVFVAMPGQRVDGRRFIADAVRGGAVAVLHEAGQTIESDVPALAITGLARLVGELARRVYDRPSERLWMVGVTGTNGKTSVSQWIAQAMNRLDHRCAVIGTLGSGFPGQLLDGLNTTPDAITIQRTLADFAEQGARACVMEVSSIGIDAGRVNGVHFDTAVFTNLTQDHLDYHGSMAAYGDAKARFFDWPGLSAAVINLDDPFGLELARRLAGRMPTVGYTLEGKLSVGGTGTARNVALTPTGISFELDGVPFAAPLVGRFNASNLLAVVCALRSAGRTLEEIAAVVPHLTPPPGRMQTLGGVDAPLVVVDYAHTPDALEKVLMTLRETAEVRGGKLVCLFGCGGERDRTKRPVMGAIAERLADRVVVSSDNPRSEDPQSIIAEILAGMRHPAPALADRGEAIAHAIAEAGNNDVVLLAGKGHESYQDLAGVRIPFSDIEQARSVLEQRS